VPPWLPLELQAVVSCLLMSISGVLHVVVVVGLVQLVFAVLGLQLFMGKMHHCSADTCCSALGVCQVSMRWWCVCCLPAIGHMLLLPGSGRRSAIRLLKYLCPAPGRLCKQPVTDIDDCMGMSNDGDMECLWTAAVFNFDNIWNAWTTLAVVMTGSGWSDALYAASDTVGIGLQPQKNYSVRWPRWPAAVVHVLAHCSAGSSA
jgi:hypothetical protein